MTSKRTTFIKITKGTTESCVPMEHSRVNVSQRCVTMGDDGDDGHGTFVITDARIVNINTTLFYR